MGKKSAPPPPDYTGAAQAQAAASQANTTNQTYANRVNQYNPWGSETYNTQDVVDPSTGQHVTQWSQNTTLDPRLASSLGAQLDVQDARSQQALGLVGRMNQEFSQPMDWSNLQQYGQGAQVGQLDAITSAAGGQPRLQTGLNFGGVQDVQGGAPAMQTAQNAAYGQAASRLDPQYATAQRDLQTQLANQGITQGSDAYTKAMDQFGRQKTDAYNQANFSSIGAGNQAAQQQQAMDLALRQQQVGEIGTQGNFRNTALGQQFGFGMGQQQQAFGQQQQAGAQNFQQQMAQSQYQNQLRQQQVAEAMQQRGFSLNEMNALMSGQQVQSPQFAGYNQAGIAQTPDLLGAAQGQYSAALDQSNAGNAQAAGTMQGVGAAASIAVMI